MHCYALLFKIRDSYKLIILIEKINGILIFIFNFKFNLITILIIKISIKYYFPSDFLKKTLENSSFLY